MITSSSQMHLHLPPCVLRRAWSGSLPVATRAQCSRMQSPTWSARWSAVHTNPTPVKCVVFFCAAQGMECCRAFALPTFIKQEQLCVLNPCISCTPFLCCAGRGVVPCLWQPGPCAERCNCLYGVPGGEPHGDARPLGHLRTRDRRRGDEQRRAHRSALPQGRQLLLSAAVQCSAAWSAATAVKRCRAVHGCFVCGYCF